jgi:hypothetical protein
VNETEDRGVRADPKGQNQHSREGESRRFPKLPDRKPKIVHHLASEMRPAALLDSDHSEGADF